MKSTSSQVLTTTSSPSLSTLWWNTNLPAHEHTPTCPSYLTYATTYPKERANLSTPDADFTRQSWQQVCSHVAANRLDQFTRVPSELRRYRRWTDEVVKEYGSVMRFVMEERLGWREGEERGGGVGRFGDPGYKDNYKILSNDWPYGLDTRIVHLVVWTKFASPSDPVTDDLLPGSRAEIDGFVRKTFGRVCGDGRVVWFRNWGSLRSVHALEHFHVMLFDPPGELVREVIGGR